jgi:paraquat-inducible protein A
VSSLKACHCCGQIHHIPTLRDAQRAACLRCGATIAHANSGAHASSRAASRTAAAATAAFVLYWPAILLPILRIEKLGQGHESSILSGTFELLAHGSWFVGIVVLLFSIVFPLAKIVLLLELSLTRLLHRRHKAWTYRAMEMLGKWSMMDVMLLAFLVMLVKLGNLVEFEFGPAVMAFVFCVAMSMLASCCFDPHSIWEDDDE